jgi:hypothetical protein
MRSAIAAVAALLALAGTSSGRLSAEDQPTVPSYSIFRTLLGGSAGNEAQPGFAVASGPATDSADGSDHAPSGAAFGGPDYGPAQVSGNAGAYAQVPAMVYSPGYNGQTPALAFRPGYNGPAYVSGAAPAMPAYGPPGAPAYYAPNSVPGYPGDMPAATPENANCYVPCLTVTAAAVLLHRANLPASRMLV